MIEYINLRAIMKCFLLFAFVLFLVRSCLSQSNNVCENYEDYYTKETNPNCWFDFRAAYNVSEIIKRSGYPVEEHEVTTSDGYILSLTRIPADQSNPNLKKSPIFIQHGALASSASFVALRNQSLAFVLSDAGYDVWMGNYRGNEYSRKHINMTIDDEKFWDHSLDELGLIDIPTQLEYLRKVSKQKGKIIYIGYSLGTTLALVYSSSYPNKAKRSVKVFILMAPAAKLTHMIAPLRLIAPIAESVFSSLKRSGMVAPMSQAEPIRNRIRQFCLASPENMKRCAEMTYLIVGPERQTGASTITILLNQFPAGTSWKVIRHAADMVVNRFGKYDYGPENIRMYNRSTPPDYDLSKINVPVYIITSAGDYLTPKEDAIILYNSLPEKIRFGIYEVKQPIFNHFNYILGVDAKALVYDHILELLDRMN